MRRCAIITNAFICIYMYGNELYVMFAFMMLLGTNDIRGITVCPAALNDNTYTISCDYVSACNFSGCSYTLTSMTDTISGKIEGNNSAMIERNEVRQKIYHLTVRDLKGVTVKSEIITFNDNLCPITTGQNLSINFVTVVITNILQQQLLLQKIYQDMVVLTSVVV